MTTQGTTTQTSSIRRRLASGSSVYGLSAFSIKAIGFALLVVYSRYLSPSDYGIVSLAESIGMVIGIISGLALDNGSRRLYFHFSGEAEHLRSYLSTLLRFATSVSVSSFILAILIGPYLAARMAPAWAIHFFPYLVLPIITAIATQLLQCRLTIYQCQERVFVYTAFVLLQSLSTTLLTLVLVVWMHHGAAGLLAARAIGASVTLLAAVFSAIPLLRAQPRWTYVRETLQISLPLVPHVLIAVGLIALDRFILQHYRPLGEIGLYSLAYNIGMIMTLVTGSLSNAWTPLFYSMMRNEREDRRTAGLIFDDLVVLLGFIAATGALLAPLCVRWFLDSRYWPAGRLTPIILCAYFCHSLFVLFQLCVIQARRTKFVGIASGLALLSNIALNLFWIPHYGIIGAAYATLGAYALELVLIAIIANYVLPIPHQWGRIFLTFLVLCAALVWTQSKVPVIPTLLFAGLLLAGCVAFLEHLRSDEKNIALPVLRQSEMLTKIDNADSLMPPMP